MFVCLFLTSMMKTFCEGMMGLVVLTNTGLSNTAMSQNTLNNHKLK